MFIFLGSERTATGRVRKPATLAKEQLISEPVEEEDVICQICLETYKADVHRGTQDEWIQCSKCTIWFHMECVRELLVVVGQDRSGKDMIGFWCAACCDEEKYFEQHSDAVKIIEIIVFVRY